MQSWIPLRCCLSSLVPLISSNKDWQTSRSRHALHRVEECFLEKTVITFCWTGTSTRWRQSFESHQICFRVINLQNNLFSHCWYSWGQGGTFETKWCALKVRVNTVSKDQNVPLAVLLGCGFSCSGITKVFGRRDDLFSNRGCGSAVGRSVNSLWMYKCLLKKNRRTRYWRRCCLCSAEFATSKHNP
jgi:hypothetical protein